MANSNYTGDVYPFGTGGQGMAGGPDEAAPDPSALAPSALGKMTNIVGAMASLALVIGVGVWGYKLMVRDVSGVPVVRALEGPMRIQPDNPGGRQADHQGLAVNAIAAGGGAAPTADRLMLATRPVELADEDVPIAQTEQAQTEQTQTDGDASADLSNMSVEALVERLTAGVKPLTGDAGQTSTREGGAVPGVQPETPETPGSQASEPVVLTGPGLVRSLRPVSRPARMVASGGEENPDRVLNAAINTAVDVVASLDVDPDSLPAGTRLAQLGAYDSAGVARAEWDKINLRFGEYMQGKQRVIQQASSGGRSFYRLRVMGFDDLSAARRFCSALVSENADCIPVTMPSASRSP